MASLRRNPFPSRFLLETYLFSALLAGAACSSGGGGGGDDGAREAGATAPPISVGFAGSSRLGEGDSLLVEVRLSLTVPELEEEVTVDLEDTGAGSATSGVDYDAIPASRVVFPAGSVDGASRTITIRARNDSLVEGVETIELELRNASDGAPLDPGRRTVSLEDDQGAVVRFVSLSSAVVEDLATRQSVAIAVEMLLQAGTTLATELSVVIEDTRDGTATAGVDYVSSLPEAVIFPAGSPSGLTRDIFVDVIDDPSAEGEETVLLELIDPSSGAVIGSRRTHSISITETDVPINPWIQLSAGGAILAPGDTIDFGSRTSAQAPADIILVVENLGASAMTHSAPVILLSTPSDTISRDFAIERLPSDETAGLLPAIADASTTTSTSTATTAPTSSSATSGTVALPSPLQPLEDSAASGITLALDDELLRDLEGRSKVKLESFPVPELGDVDLELERAPSPWAPGATVVVDGRKRDPHSLTGPVSFWKGKVVGDEKSHVFLSVSESRSCGWIECDAIPGGVAHLVPDGETGASATFGNRTAMRARVALARQLGPGPQPRSFCSGTVATPSSGALYGAGIVPSALAPTQDGDETAPLVAALPQVSGEPAGSLRELRLAIETDYQLFRLVDSTPNGLAAFVTQLVASVNAIYERDLHTTLSLVYLGIYISPSQDPWETPDLADDSGGGSNQTFEGSLTGDLLMEFQTAWGTNWPDTASNAHIAHFLSGASIGGGRAFVLSDVNRFCSREFNFGVSELFPGLGNWDTIVVAHEIGHNLGALHTHEYCPPIDRCFNPRGECETCPGYGCSCSEGTILSYCGLCGDGLSNVRLQFHPQVANLLRFQLNAAPCVSQSVLGSGGLARYRLRFAPTTGPGEKIVTVSLFHNATNRPAPFTFRLRGLAR